MTRPVARLDRAQRQLATKRKLTARQPVGGPRAAASAAWLKPPPVVDAGHHLVVVAAHQADLPGQPAHAFDHLVGAGAVAHQVAEHQHRVEVLAARAPQHRVERVAVAVHVGEDQVAHGRFLEPEHDPAAIWSAAPPPRPRSSVSAMAR